MTTHSLSFRPYEAADNAVLTEIWHAASTLAHPFLGEARLLAHRKLVSELYLPEAETWVACLDGKPVGFIGLLECYIGGIFVAPDVQGQGIGQALIAHSLSLKPHLDLDVYGRNQRSCDFYKQLGFKEVARRPTDKEGLPFEEISMRLTR